MNVSTKMKNSASQNYSYAIDIDDNLIHVSNAVRNVQYYCPYCHEMMVPHMGKQRRWHFTHKANIENCNYETYLHKIAKIEIRKAFLNSSRFVISYNVPTICNKVESCKISNGNFCVCQDVIEHDIKQFYDKCDEEATYKNYVADLLLSSSIRPEREPLLIEIWVTHKSTIEKVNDGVRIIEIRIKNEEDIVKIVTSLRIDGIRASKMDIRNSGFSKNVFYNFKGQISKDPSFFNEMMPRFIYYLWMYDSGYFKADKCLCDEDPFKYIPANAHYVTCPVPFMWQWAFIEFVKRGVDVKNCLICKYSAVSSQFLREERICTLYKKYGTPRHPGITVGKTCKYFRRIDVSDPKYLLFSPYPNGDYNDRCTFGILNKG